MAVHINESRNIRDIRSNRARAGERTRTAAVQPISPTLRWWEWIKIAGGVGLVVMAITIAAGYTPPPAIVAVVLHVFADFTCQSSETAKRKAERGRHLLIHALGAGGTPLAVAGFMTGNPATALIWTGIGVASHYAVDWTRKFGLKQALLGTVLDQACHLATILALTVIPWI